MQAPFEPEIEENEFIAKLKQKCQDQPAVVLGTFATTLAVSLATRLLRRGQKLKTQTYFRYRVVAQLLTIVALVVGGLFIAQESEEQRQSREDELAEKAKQREALWVKELEMRDAEIQARKRRIQKSQDDLREIAGKEFENARAKNREKEEQDES